jgi:hypothetical protein
VILRAFHPVLEPLADGRVLDVEVVRADRPAVGPFEPVQDLAHRNRRAVRDGIGDRPVEVRLGEAEVGGLEVARHGTRSAQRIDLGDQVPARAEAPEERLRAPREFGGGAGGFAGRRGAVGRRARDEGPDHPVRIAGRLPARLACPPEEPLGRERGGELRPGFEAVGIGRERREVLPPCLGNGLGMAEEFGIESLHEREAQRVGVLWVEIGHNPRFGRVFDVWMAPTPQSFDGRIGIATPWEDTRKDRSPRRADYDARARQAVHQLSRLQYRCFRPIPKGSYRARAAYDSRAE